MHVGERVCDVMGTEARKGQKVGKHKHRINVEQNTQRTEMETCVSVSCGINKNERGYVCFPPSLAINGLGRPFTQWYSSKVPASESEYHNFKSTVQIDFF